MKIGFLLGNLQGNGGIARVVSIIANQLCENYNIHIISFCPAMEPAGYEYDERIICKQLYKSRITMTNAILKGHAVLKLRSYIKENEIDILIACGELYFPLTILSVLGTRIKSFCWEHSDPAGTSDHKFQIFSRKMAVAFANRIIVLTKAAECYYITKFKCKSSKLYQIYNPVDSNVSQSSSYNGKSKRILSVGRLTYQKNFQLLIQIAADVLKKHPEWTWDICGEGEERKELEELIGKYGIENRLVLRGQVRNLYKQYGEYSFMVMTSRYEGFPMSLIEAEANRLPLVSFDIPTGPSEIIRDGENGFLLSAFDVEGMSDKISFLMEKEDVRKEMSEKSYMASHEYDIKKIIEKWNDLFFYS